MVLLACFPPLQYFPSRLQRRTAQQLHEKLRALSLRLSADDLKQLDEVSQPAWGYPYGFIGAREPW